MSVRAAVSFIRSPQRMGKVFNYVVTAGGDVRFSQPFTLRFTTVATEEIYGVLIDSHALRTAIDMLYDLHLRLDLEHEADVLIHGRRGRRRRQRERMLSRMQACRDLICRLETALREAN